jgi:hypothetical protein
MRAELIAAAAAGLVLAPPAAARSLGIPPFFNRLAPY